MPVCPGLCNSSKQKRVKSPAVKLPSIDEVDEEIATPVTNSEQGDFERDSSCSSSTSEHLSHVDDSDGDYDDADDDTDAEDVEKVGEDFATETTRVRRLALRKQQVRRLAMRKEQTTKITGMPDVPKSLVETGEEYLQSFLRQCISSSSSRVFDVISKKGKLITFDKNEFILRKGDNNDYVYIIVSGGVDILASDGDTVIASLGEGGIFGDVTVMFDVPCTANVKSRRETNAICLHKEDFMTVINNGIEGGRSRDIDIIDWFVKRRYLPTSDCIDAPRFYRRVTFNTIKDLQIPLFKDWTDSSIKSLILECDHSLVLLYPKKSKLLIEGDPQNSVLIVIDGTVEITTEGKSVVTIVTTNAHAPFVFGEYGIVLGDQSADVTISAVTACKIIRLEREWIIDIVEQHSNLRNDFQRNAFVLRQFTSSLKYLQGRQTGHLNFDLLFHHAVSAEFYAQSGRDLYELWLKVADSDVQQYAKGEELLDNRDGVMYESLMVVRGMVVVRENHHVVDTTANGLDNTPTLTAAALSKGINEFKVLDLDQGAAVKKVIGIGHVMPTGKRERGSLHAYTDCVVLKIKNTVSVDVHEKDTRTKNKKRLATSLEFV